MDRKWILCGIFALSVFSANAQDFDLDALKAKANNADVEAAAMLGKYYYDVEKDLNQAEMWAKAAAGAGNAEAQYYLAKIYDAGTEGKHLNKEIVSILEKSAEQGYAAAQLMLGRIYQFGRRGIPQDLKKARMWYEMAAAKGANEAMTQLNVIYQQSGDAATKASMADENVEWLELGAQQGNAEAALMLGKMVETGRRLPQNFKRAAELYQIAAEAGLVQGEAALGKLYANGEGVPQDNEKAIFWLTKAAEQGYAEAQRKLASVYTYQYPDPAQAYAWQVISLSALFPNAPDLVQVSPDLERLLRSMTPDQIKDGQALAVKMVEKIKQNKREQEEAQKKQMEQMRQYQQGIL
ncbi:MAG: sel1 repeat family protein [Alphaproteobacteria bacterium]|nr:sel1 repeat family protein [Alphaproteobacteria bacterium]